MPPQNMLVAQGFLPENSMKLARFVVNVAEPQVSWHDPLLSITPSDVLVRQHTNYQETQQGGSSDNFAATLSKLAAARCSKAVQASTRVSSGQVTTYQLQNSGGWFRKAVTQAATRAWIVEQSDDGWDRLYFVVGYHTMRDASVVVGADERKSASGDVAVPVSGVLAASGIVLPAGGMLDPQLSAKREEHQGAHVQFVAPGERVCALQYRKVVFRWFSSRDIDKATLDKENRWQTVDTLRSLRPNDEHPPGEDDVLEVDVADDLEDDGVDMESCVVDDTDGEFFY